MRKWLTNTGSVTLFTEPGSPWENGYVESFNGKVRDELLNGEIFDTPLEAKVIVGQWVNHYNNVRPHSAPQTVIPAGAPAAAHQRRHPGDRTVRTAVGARSFDG